MKEMKVLPAEDFRAFTSAVIDAKSFKNIKGYLEFAHSSPDCNVLAGGNADDRWGRGQSLMYCLTNTLWVD